MFKIDNPKPIHLLDFMEQGKIRAWFDIQNGKATAGGNLDVAAEKMFDIISQHVNKKIQNLIDEAVAAHKPKHKPDAMYELIGVLALNGLPLSDKQLDALKSKFNKYE